MLLKLTPPLGSTIAEMVVPEVDKELLAELESMGFSAARATRALYFTGSTLSQ